MIINHNWDLMYNNVNCIQWKEIKTVFTQEEKLYFERMKAMKIFRPKDVRSKFRIVLDQIPLKIHDN